MEDYFAPLRLEDTFRRVIHVFLKRWKDFMAISFLVYLAGFLFAILTALLMGNDLKIDGFSIQPQLFRITFSSNGGVSNTLSSAHLNNWTRLTYLLESLIYFCFSCVANGATIWLATHLYLDQYPSIREGFSNAGKKLFALTLSLFLTSVMGVMLGLMFITCVALPLGRDYIGLAMFLAFIFNVFLQIVFYHAYPSIMVEGVGPLQALSRSWEISSGHWCYLFCVLLLWGCFRSVVGLIIGKIAQTGYHIDIFYNAFQVSYGWQYYLAQFLDTGFGILFLGLSSVFQAVLYLRNRVANESLDKVSLASELGSTEDGVYITMTNDLSSNEKATIEKSEDPKHLV